MLRELAERYPETDQRIDRQNPRRVIRAIEVLRLTGKPFSTQRANRARASRITHHAPCSFVLNRQLSDLRRRIDARVDDMFRRGLVAETEQLLRRGLAENQTAMQALGYRQVAEYLRGARSLPETIELVKIRTRQFAKRQLTWFRRQLRLTWIMVWPEESPEAVAERARAEMGDE